MPVNGSEFDSRLWPLYLSGHDGLSREDWFDGHTHIGQNDPDGRTATAEEIIGGLDAAGHQRALVFAMHEPDGYGPANDAVLSAAAESGGRLVPLARVNPNAEDAQAEAQRCLGLGARGFKLHPRSDAFTLAHPGVEPVIALAHERRTPVVIHAGRGIPHLGEDVVALARRYHGARLILAHAGITDLGWIAPAAAELPNLFFDTAWWHVSDHLQLYATIPPGQILYASDMPYGPGVFTAFVFLRCSMTVGLPLEVRREIAGGQLARVVAGEEPADLGPPPGPDAVGERLIEAERVLTYIAAALQVSFRGLDPTEPLSLARLACRTSRDGETRKLLDLAGDLLEMSLAEVAADPDTPRAGLAPAMLAHTLAGTSRAGLPGVTL